MKAKLVEEKFSYILFKIGDIGPEQVFYENIPTGISDRFKEQRSIEIGVYLSLVISQGKGLDKEGLFGPLPWYQLPEHELFLFSFLVDDLEIKDKRKKGKTLAFLVVMFPRKDEVLINSRYEIQKSLEQQLIRPEGKRIQLNKENISFIIQNSAIIFSQAYESGKKVLQEQTVDEILSFNEIEFFAMYSLSSNQLRTCLIGDKKNLPEKEFIISKTIDNQLISVKEHKDGSTSIRIKEMELDILIFVKLKFVVTIQKFISLLTKIDATVEILASYI